jgi:DNA-binding transcriptional ArsR family regulator
MALPATVTTPEFEALEQMFSSAKQACNLLKSLSHESRLLMLCILSNGEKSVTELEEILQMRQSAVSQQLSRLRIDGLVEARREGKAIYYCLANEDVKKVISVLYDIYCAAPDSDCTA